MEFYRLPIDVVQISKLGQILTAMENGTYIRSSGSSLDDVIIEDKEQEDTEEREDTEEKEETNNQDRYQ